MTLDTVDPHIIIKSIKQKIYVKNADGVYTWVNDHFAEVAGIPASLVIGKRDHDLPWSAQADFYGEDDKQVMTGISLSNVERYQSRSDGITKIILNLTPYVDNFGKITGVIGNFFDLSHHVTQSRGVFTNSKFYLEFNNEYLTKAELIVMMFLFHGFDPAGIGQRTNTSVTTVRYHLDNIRVKMGCQRTNEIQKVAIENGIFFHIYTLQHDIDE